LKNIVACQDRQNNRKSTFHFFIEEICNEILGKCTDVFTNIRVSDPEIQSKKDLRILLHLPERPVEATRNQRCYICLAKFKEMKKSCPELTTSQLPKQSKIVYRCITCKVYQSGENNCFEIYHRVKR
jgi:hypothetical protein